MKEFLEKLKQTVIKYVVWAENEYVGEPGSVKREAVIEKVAGLVDIPFLPGFVEDPMKRIVIGFLIDLAVDKLNWLTGYSFKGAELSEESQARLAAAVDAPLPAVRSAAASAGTLEDKINALYEKYGIEATVSKQETVETPPRQETAQAQTPTPTTAQWDKILSFVLAREGGYVNDPDDPGGETNRGITKATLAAAYAQGLVSHNVVKDVTREDASKIYEARYYKCYGYDRLPFAVSLVLTDATVNHGRGGAALIVQRALVSLGYAIAMDGKWGPKTQAALDEAVRQRPMVLAQMILTKRKNYYDNIISSKPSQEKYRNGWYNRLKALATTTGIANPC